jgi:DNA-binding NtrC family response regulator
VTRVPLRVCVVEDETRLRELLVRELEAMGFSAAGYRSAEDAWPALLGDPFHAALIDLNLPGEDGMGLFQRLREARPDVAIVILTGFGTLDSAVKALRWGAVDYLTKPCNLSDIESVLARVEASRRDAEIARRAEAHGAEAPPSPKPAPAAGRTLEELEREQILSVLRSLDGNKPAAAQALGISLRTLYNKLGAYRAQGLLD